MSKNRKDKEERDEKRFLGGLFQFFYEMSKEYFKTPENDCVFDYIESIGDEVRISLEEDLDYKDLYKSADVLKKGKEFLDAVLRLFRES